MSNINVCDFNLQRNHGLLNDLSLQLVNITHLQFVLDIRDDSNWHYVSSYACRLVEACGLLQKLMIKVCIN